MPSILLEICDTVMIIMDRRPAFLELTRENVWRLRSNNEDGED